MNCDEDPSPLLILSITYFFVYERINFRVIGNIGLREKITKTKNTQDHIEKKDHKNEKCKIILTDNDSLTMSSSQFTLDFFCREIFL
jgi:hypothetical protein